MWRSHARALIFGASIRKSSSSGLKVPILNLTLTSSPPPSSSNWIFQANRHFQNSRLFSHTPDSTNEDVKESDPLRSHKNDEFWNDTPPFASHDSDISSNIVEKSSESLDDLSVITDTGIDECDTSGMDSAAVAQDSDDSSVVLEGGIDDLNVELVEVDVEQIEKVLSILQSSLGTPLESSLSDLDLTLSEEFVLRIIETPHVLGDKLLGFFKWASKQPDFSVNTRVLDSLVSAICVSCRKKEVYSLWDLVKEMDGEDKGLVHAGILNDLISMFWKLGKGKAALEVFNKFEDFACQPDVDTYYLTIEALCRRSLYDDAWLVSEKLLNTGKLPDSEKIGKIITSLCKGSKAKDAHLVYLMAKENHKYPPKSSVNFLISKLCGDDGTVLLALEMLGDISGGYRKYAIKPFCVVLRALCRIKEIAEAKKLLFKMIESGPPPGNAAFNSVISGLSKSADMQEAIALMKVMESRGLRPDVYTYSAIMSGYTKGGQMDDAHKIFFEAKKVHPMLCPVTYHILIRGYCKMEEFEKALECLREMKEDGVQPNHDEYNKMIQSLCLRALDWRTAEVLLDEMTQNGLHLNGITRGLIKAVKEMEEEALQMEEVKSEAHNLHDSLEQV